MISRPKTAVPKKPVTPRNFEAWAGVHSSEASNFVEHKIDLVEEALARQDERVEELNGDLVALNKVYSDLKDDKERILLPCSGLG